MRRSWVGATLLVAVVYLVVGIGTARGGRWTNPSHMSWRLAAWLLSAIAFASHIAYEQLRLRSTALATALHAALAAAIGAFGLAAAALLHAQTRFALHALSLAAWPLLVAVPAFLVAFVLAAGLRAIRPAE